MLYVAQAGKGAEAIQHQLAGVRVDLSASCGYHDLLGLLRNRRIWIKVEFHLLSAGAQWSGDASHHERCGLHVAAEGGVDDHALHGGCSLSQLLFEQRALIE